MALSIIILLCLSLTFSIFLTANPLTLGIWTLLMAFIFSLTILLFTSSWFAISILLIYVGGIIVMFSYFTALTPNHQLNISLIFLTSPLVLIASAPLITLISPMAAQPLSAPPSISIIFNSYNISVLLLLVITLFLVLVAVVKITSKFRGPLRPFQ